MQVNGSAGGGNWRFFLRGRRQPRSCSLFSKLNCCQSTKRSTGLGNLTEMRVSSAFSTLPRRGFGHHPPTDSAAAGTKVGPGRVASVALHRRPGNTKNDRSIAPVVPFVVVWSCFPLRFTGTTTPHLSIAPTRVRAVLSFTLFLKTNPAPIHIRLPISPVSATRSLQPPFICIEFQPHRDEIKSVPIDSSIFLPHQQYPVIPNSSIKRTALAFCFLRAVAHPTARFFPENLCQDALPKTPRDPGRRAVGCRRHRGHAH